MHTHNHCLIGAAAAIPVTDATLIISFSPVVLSTPERAVNLELRITVPATGDALPIVLLAHGQGRSSWLSSMNVYTPLFESSASRRPRAGATDMMHILDNLDAIEAPVPGLKGRLHRSRIAVAGHSASLLGARNTDPRDGTTWYKPDPRVRAGGPDFSKMERPVLVVCGDEDGGPHLNIRGADWHVDAYAMVPGVKDLVWLKGGHELGGLSGWEAAETQDESPQMPRAVRRTTWEYMRSQLYEGHDVWAKACKVFGGLEMLGKIESKK
ncbi:hypothetical protein DFH08DRAFT_950770 [Mycena albidolilacea]|uniref:Chlorophyllase n=1 Tax=Mycena albidolilacea TaxID=1033008 RepID=A0AAD7ALK9_9AGAR|nr:hypothetical protein DFH08DRAFT_950770 [Mycena albidolilacea]